MPATRVLKFKLMAIVFVGLHVPLTAVAAYALLLGAKELLPLVGIAFVATLIAAVGTLALLYRMLPDPADPQPMRQALH